jgi:hypothetical protein
MTDHLQSTDMLADNFRSELIKRVKYNLEKLYLPTLKQNQFFQTILHQILLASNTSGYQVRSYTLMEIADREFIVKVNNQIEVTFIVHKNKEVTYE